MPAAAHDVSFEPTTVGDILGPEPVDFTNTGASAVTGFSIGGADPDDFTESDTCTFPLAMGATCDVDVFFVPGELGPRTGTLVPLSGSAQDAPVATLSGGRSSPKWGVARQTMSAGRPALRAWR